ncbi:MAG: hypothetical protein AAFX78_07885 [Cyanobacteria bacterium J06638_20]
MNDGLMNDKSVKQTNSSAISSPKFSPNQNPAQNGQNVRHEASNVRHRFGIKSRSRPRIDSPIELKAQRKASRYNNSSIFEENTVQNANPGEAAAHCSGKQKASGRQTTGRKQALGNIKNLGIAIRK